MSRIPIDFYRSTDVVSLARALIGKTLVTRINGQITSGIIAETEAYNGINDKACHAFGGKRTTRNEPMYKSGGIAYIYLCYGLHHLFNVVCSDENDPKVVLIRAIHPQRGITEILNRRKIHSLKPDSCVGPGKAAQALGISSNFSGVSLLGSIIWLQDDGIKLPLAFLQTGPRIGVEYAGKDAGLPYRFYTDPKKYLTCFH